MTGIVKGFHGTRLNYVESILRDGFSLSRNDYDWLGDGVYFFQDGLQLAEEWSRKTFGEHGVVIGASIDLVDCMDLVDSRWVNFLKQAHDQLLAKLEKDNMVPPAQSIGAHRLDRAVINYAVSSLAKRGHQVRSVRAPFHEGDPLYPNSALYTKSHIQIAVRDNSVIKEVWLETKTPRRLTND